MSFVLQGPIYLNPNPNWSFKCFLVQGNGRTYILLGWILDSRERPSDVKQNELNQKSPMSSFARIIKPIKKDDAQTLTRMN